MRVAEWLWYGNDAGARVARALLAPVSRVYAAGAAVAHRRHSAGAAAQLDAIPAMSVGNLSVGGTGKTPVAAWAAAELVARGARPAIVMRGYGDDEPLVHARLNPAVPVVTDPDRIRGAQRAREMGADCVILDDAFQHRRVARVSDWVLVSAEQWRDDQRVLPAGPLREPLRALARADVIMVTRKSADRETSERIAELLAFRFPSAGMTLCHLVPGSLVDARTGETRSLSWLRGRRVTAAAAIGIPSAFFAQLRALGALVDAHAYRDHHSFNAGDVATLAAAAERYAGLVCTLKDAVKLAPLWPPAAAPLLYVSQTVVIERGAAVLEHAFETVLAARLAVSSTAGAAGPSIPLHGHRSSTAD